MSTNPNPNVDSDPDATARLPTIEPVPGSAESAEAGLDTDVLPLPAVPVGTTELADRLREVEQRLDQKNERVRELESLLQQSDQQIAALDAQLVEARTRQLELEAQLGEARAHAQVQSQLVAEQRTAATRHHDQDLTDLRHRTSRQMEALTTWQGFRAVSDSQLAEAEANNALLEAKVATLSQSLRALEASRARSLPEGQVEALKSQVSALQSQVATLRADLAEARKNLPPRQDVRDSSESEQNSTDNQEAPVNASVVMYGDRWEYTEEPDDSPTGEVEQSPGNKREPPAEAPLRALVRLDGGGELIYPIGKRTTIGRTPDNDLQIDSPSVSRHHAVLLVSADHCRVEDLDSTNGILVNGTRIVRKELQDGDTLTIGKAEFRFMQRS